MHHLLTNVVPPLARILCGALFMATPCCWAQGWLPNWDVTQSSSLGVGYDSDIYGADVLDVEDGFAQLNHTFSIARKNSLTELEASARATGARYFSERDADFLDGGVQLAMAYPASANDVSFWRGSAFWERVTDLDLSTARRMQPTLHGARLRGEWYASPKLGLSGALEHLVNDRSADGATRSRKLRLRTGVSHELFPEQWWNYEYAYTKGRTNVGGESDIHEAGVRVRGRVLPKVTGEAFVGVQRAEYSGRQTFADTGPSASVDLTWRSSPRLAAKLELERESDFASNGSAQLRSVATLSMERDLGQGYQLSAYLTRGWLSYDDVGEDRSDRYWMVGGKLEYAFTQRFFVELSCAHLSNVSSIGELDVSRTMLLIQSGIRY